MFKQNWVIKADARCYHVNLKMFNYESNLTRKHVII